ncbi:uncharacterized protein LOC122626691 isoform X2 [Drosophila teissieri]|uniref:uncharacterized protein LOC122626691 isoform X2 n=1 Tax=Drosophila teissieri TaxID=7243 RepID=UPI001CB9EA2B|nr:uncharacterized protein LOC122626691 isoform X2 [Drosophila teissieri]
MPLAKHQRRAAQAAQDAKGSPGAQKPRTTKWHYNALCGDVELWMGRWWVVGAVGTGCSGAGCPGNWGLGVWLLKHIANRLHNELRFAFQDTQVEIE